MTGDGDGDNRQIGNWNTGSQIADIATQSQPEDSQVMGCRQPPADAVGWRRWGRLVLRVAGVPCVAIEALKKNERPRTCAGSPSKKHPTHLGFFFIAFPSAALLSESQNPLKASPCRKFFTKNERKFHVVFWYFSLRFWSCLCMGS
jgi:hypothetical protein